ncbi:50S ribosomal protein L33 [Conexibacter sp. W3-3-2]|uniref:Large ribosomal subunit protein bL33 n=1 Tax=Paraconexibacter algicola TaxID=2133960 RepID=A0A2T4UHX2_9ACTN|nr:MULTISPECIES: 50S ribosomal protein L33 [Solirubrobacterales]MTD45111.1 50S ribosomal protein L33 [Conexibacter sp. W3-3-2]PTL58805.1 50S ribosomal protein L33 [Paraconexibacter algicola]
MAKKGDTRVTIRLESTAGTGTTYWTTKSKRNTPGRLELRKYDKRIRQTVLFRESR